MGFRKLLVEFLPRRRFSLKVLDFTFISSRVLPSYSKGRTEKVVQPSFV